MSKFFQPWAEIDGIDQTLHVVVGAAMTGLACLVMPWYWALILSMAVAAMREQWQHPMNCHAGCRTDLAFWLGGSLLVSGLFIGFDG